MIEYIRRDTITLTDFEIVMCDGDYKEALAILLNKVEKAPAADVVEVVRCKDCKHRKLNEHYGEKGYLRIKAMCVLDTGDPFELSRCAEDDDWFCADGERKDGGQDE